MAITAEAHDRQDLEHAVRDLSTAIADMVRPLPTTDIPLPDSLWTVGETAAHLAMAQRYFGDLAQRRSELARPGTEPPGELTPERFASSNAARLEQFTERDGSKLAGQLEEATDHFLEQVAGCRDDELVYSHFGALDAVTWTSYSLCHLLMHGLPLARAAGAQLDIQPYAALTLRFLRRVLPLVVDKQAAKGLTACFEIRIPSLPPFTLNLRDGVPSAAPPSMPPDCTISSHAVDFFLVSLRLLPLEEALEAGRWTVAGPRPDLAARFNELFRNP